MIGVLSRLLPHPANFTAVPALALFSGAHIGLRKAVIVTVATMVISDIMLGFHSVMWATYGSMAFTAVLGYLARNRSFKVLAAVTLFSSLQFFIITNFAVWLAPNTLYPKTLLGLLQSYIMALPFFRNSLLGDVLYTTVFFVGYEYVSHRNLIFSTQKKI